MDKSQRHGIFCTTAGAIAWGFSGTCGQYLFTNFTIDSPWLTAVRLLLAGGILTVWSLMFRRKKVTAMFKGKQSRIMIFIIAVFGFMLCQYSYLTGIKYSNAATTTVLQNLSLAFITVFVSIRTHIFPGKKQIIAVILAFLGVYFLATGGNPGNMVLSSKGLFWGIASALAVCSYSLLTKKTVEKYSAPVVSGCGMLIGGVILSVIIRIWTIPANYDASAWIYIMLIVIIGTVVAFGMFLEGVRCIGPVKATLIGCLEPVSATVISAVWLHSHFTAVDIAGFALIMFSVFLFAVE